MNNKQNKAERLMADVYGGSDMDAYHHALCAKCHR